MKATWSTSAISSAFYSGSRLAGTAGSDASADGSPSPCLRRVRALEDSRATDRYVALVDPEIAGLSVSAFVRVRLDRQDDRHLAMFEEVVRDVPEVMECYLMTGDADYRLRVLVPSLDAFEDFLRSKLTRIDGVSEVTTSFALRPIVYRTAIPL